MLNYFVLRSSVIIFYCFISFYCWTSKLTCFIILFSWMDSYHQQSFIHPHHHDNTPLNVPSLLPLASHIFAIVFCYIVGTFGLNVLFIMPVLLLLWLRWEHRYRLLAWTTELRVEYASIRQQVLKSGESVEWMNEIIEKW